MRPGIIARALIFLLLAGVSCVHAEEPSWCIAVWYPSSEHPGGAEAITRN